MRVLTIEFYNIRLFFITFANELKFIETFFVMIDAKAIYIILIYAVCITPIILGLFLFLFSIPKSLELKPYLLSRKVLAIAYLAMGVLNVLGAAASGKQLGENAFMMANLTLIVASCQAHPFTFAIITLIDPDFVSHRWNKWQWCFITAGCTGVITGFFLDLLAWQYIVFILFLAFYIYQLIHYTWLFIKKKKSYINKVENYFSGYEIYLLKWIDIAFFSALSIGISALFTAVFPSIWFSIILCLICCAFYLFFAIKYLEYPQLFNKIQAVIWSKKNTSYPIGMHLKQDTIEQKMEEWIKEKHFLQQEITIKDLSRELGFKQRTVLFYINIHLQMNFKNWLLYLQKKENQQKLKETKTQLDENKDIFVRFEQLITSEKLFLVPDLQREDAAKKLNTNTVYLSAAIRENTNQSFGDYINCLRLDYARLLLSDPNKKHMLISLIATDSGFKSLRTFNRAFKERFGITPGEEKDGG